MKQRFALVPLLLALIASSSSAQRSTSGRLPCTSADAPAYLSFFEKYFRDPDMDEVRGNHIRLLSPTETQEVVTNRGLCEAMAVAAVRMMAQYEPSWPAIERDGFDAVVLRYGDYYAVLIKYAVDPATSRPPAYVPLLIFRVRDRRYLTTILV